MTIPEPQHTPTRYASTVQQEHRKTRGSSRTHFFSVIVCTYNRCKLVLATIESLRQQTLPSRLFEIILVDNDSNDGTAEIIEAYIHTHKLIQQGKDSSTSFMKPINPMSKIRYIKETQNGLACARNTGVCHASGDIVVFLDDDTFVDKTFLERLLTTYNETGADAVGGCVDLSWEAPRPYWFSNDLLEMLGYFQPFRIRTQLPEALSLSKLNFSIKRTLLLEMGGFIPFLGKRLHTPMSIEVAYLCQQLQHAGSSIWYDPALRVLHRISDAYITRAFLLGHAYWDGRAEVMASYAHQLAQATQPTTTQQRRTIRRNTVRMLLYEWRELLQLALFHRPLLSLARKSANERLTAAIAQSHLWGCIRQRLSLMNHAPSTIAYPEILLLQAHEQDGLHLQQGFRAIGLYCTTSIAQLPLSWLWQHRASQQNITGVIHCYRPGAFQLQHWQRQQLIIRLWLARRMGIPIVTTDAGGWWQHTRIETARQRQTFEQHIFQSSHLILSYSRHTAQLYPDPQLRKRVHTLSHPGLHGLIPNLTTRDQAIRQFDINILAQPQPFIYLCFVHYHTEREILSLTEAFVEALATLPADTTQAHPPLHLIIAGTPCDKQHEEKIAQHATQHKPTHTHIHIHNMQPSAADIPFYLALSDALVVPHASIRSAGTLDMAYLWYSYEKIVIIPDLPRFQAIFPAHASLVYDPESHTSLVQALQKAINHTYHHTPEEQNKRDLHRAWRHHAQRIQALHRLHLHHP